MNFQDLISRKNENVGMSESLIDDGIQSLNNDCPQTPLARTVDHEAQIIVGDVSRGEKQATHYRDAWAAAIFIVQLCIVGFLGFVWEMQSLNFKTRTTFGGGDDTNSFNFWRPFFYCLLCSIVALVVSAGALSLLTRKAQHLIQFIVFFSMISDAIIGVYFGLQKNWFAMIVSVIFLLYAMFYTASVWRRIPFAAANLETALTAVRSNGGITFVALGTAVIFNVFYTGIWILAWLGVYVRYTAKDCQQQDGTCFSHANPVVVLFLLLCLFWSWEVGRNVLHATVAGVVGTWWFAPDEACTFFSPSITDSLSRATSYSFGSICLGSVLTGLLQFCNHVAREARRYGGNNEMLMCVIECISSFLERLVTYFNKWAYVYIGLYGYDYLTAGKKVMDLFWGRGWTAIINDNLVVRVLGLVSFLIGILTATAALVFGKFHPSWVFAFGTGGIIDFMVPFIIGTSVAHILMGVVSSAVDTVLVAFCEAPLEFERNHPGLHQQMTSAWIHIYPDEFGQHEPK